MFLCCTCTVKKHGNETEGVKECIARLLYQVHRKLSKYIKLWSLFVCLFFYCPIITQEPLHRFASNFDWGTGEPHGNVPSLVLVVITIWVGWL